MQKTSPPAPPWSFAALPPGEQQRMLELAASLERHALAGQPLQTLRGKNLAVLCEDARCPRLGAFRRAAGELGAQVTHIRPSEALNSSLTKPDAVGHVLGRLYDAIDCHGLDADTVERLERVTGRPVFNDLACHHGLQTGDSPRPDFLLQAVLLSSLG